ncbi:YjdJ family protein [Rossellomorea sp. NS-SX7]|uniref:YjdJ family protein n=1 Tax=Rossellomorea sp. NS-SX7 TaxID=3463856 RepID=UPI004057F071
MNRYVIQIGLGMGFLLFSVFATLYEGSGIVDSPFEWEYSTPFSGEVENAGDISPLDYFVYAIKFKPTFPIVMAVSSMYLLVVTGNLFMNRKRFFTFYLPFLAVLQLTLGWLMSSAVTTGTQVLSYVFLSSGALILAAALLYHFTPPGKGVVSNKR